MGKTKQLLPFNGMTLLEHCIKNVLMCPVDEVITIIGHRSDIIKEKVTIDDPRFKWKYNVHYREGQSSALKAAITGLNHSDGMMVFLADQPFIKEKMIRIILERVRELLPMIHNGLVVQPSYHGKKGHPVFFSRHLYSLFYQLHGDEGGKKIINKASHYENVCVSDAGILFDIDTPKDYEKLLSYSLTEK
ncbi:nucleotidyltransferase family protein [bacterium LRH843]|nr:nucleotidyltransferase family protein [bacterium LRH843]